MENTTHKPIKIEAGQYIYRGVRITKGTTRGFTATRYTKTDWHWIGRTTLKECTKAIDSSIAEGFIVDRHKLYSPEYHAQYITSRNA